MGKRVQGWECIRVRRCKVERAGRHKGGILRAPFHPPTLVPSCSCTPGLVHGQPLTRLQTVLDIHFHSHMQTLPPPDIFHSVYCKITEKKVGGKKKYYSLYLGMRSSANVGCPITVCLNLLVADLK